jgi:hypothetical protein
VSSQDSPYPDSAETGASGAFTLAPSRTRDRYWLHALLLALTLVTTSMVGAAMQSDFERNVPFELERSLELFGFFWSHPGALLQGVPYSLTLLLILLAHEFGHYLAAAFHQVDSSLPFFLEIVEKEAVEEKLWLCKTRRTAKLGKVEYLTELAYPCENVRPFAESGQDEIALRE